MFDVRGNPSVRKISRDAAERQVAKEKEDGQMNIFRYYIEQDQGQEYLMLDRGFSHTEVVAEIVDGETLDCEIRVRSDELRNALTKLRLPEPVGNISLLGALAEGLGFIGDPRAEHLLEEVFRFVKGKTTEGVRAADAIAIFPRIKRALSLVAPENHLLVNSE